MKYACRILELLREGKDPSPPELPVVFFEDDGDNDELKVAAAYFEGEAASLQAGDVIQAVADQPGPVKNATQLINVLRGQQGDATLSIGRDGKAMAVKLHLKPTPSVMQRQGLYVAGMLIGPSGFQDAPEANLGKLLAVHYVADGSPASAQGLQMWDMIKSVDGKPFHDIDTLLAYLKERNRPVQLVIKRLSESNDKIYEYHEFELPVEELRLVGTDKA